MFALTLEQKNRLKRINTLKLVVFLSILGVAGTVLFIVNNLFVSLLLAFVIAYLARPLLVLLERAGFGYHQALVFVFVCGAVVAGGLGMWLFPFVSGQISHLQTEWPRYFSGLVGLMENFESQTKTWLGFSLSLKEMGEEKLLSLGQVILKDLPSLLIQVITVLILAPFLGFFILKDGHKISRHFMRMVPNSVFEMTLGLQHQINQQLGLFIRARFLEAFIVGLVTFLGLSVISFPFAFLLGGFAALTNLIPYLGPILGAVPALAIALINNYPLFDLSLVILVYGIAQAIDASILVPILVARIVNLHPVTVVLLIILGGQFMGVLGMIISIPLANACKVTFVAVYDHLTNSET